MCTNCVSITFITYIIKIGTWNIAYNIILYIDILAILQFK